MKKLFVILVMMSACLCALAQPDYISQAQNSVNKYYPQHVEYFNPIFAQINSISKRTKEIVNQKIKENLDLFDEELSTDKDKMTAILLVLEQLTSKKQFRNFSDVGLLEQDNRVEIAQEIVSDINSQMKKDITNIRSESEKIARRSEKLKDIIEFVNLNNKNQEATRIIISKMDVYFSLYDDNELMKDIQEDASLQKIIKQYIYLTKEYGIIPSASGKRAIDAYNKYHK